MISKIHIQNFKSLENVTLECSNLNVLTGLNGMGKSSVIQALLLLRQSYERGLLENEGLSLNGDLTSIGSGKEALYEFSKTDEINFNLEFNDNEEFNDLNWYFSYQLNNPDTGDLNYAGSDFLPFSYSEVKDENGTMSVSEVPKDLHKYNFFKRNTFNYLNADRWVQNEYDISDFHVIRSNNLGVHGQYTTHFLNQFQSKPIHTSLLFPDVEANELLIQVSAWLGEISPGTKVSTDRISGSNSVKLRYSFEANGVATFETSPLNVGFGITYVLPVLVALLSSKSGDIIIIENPESHIHPKGQSAIGKLMCKVAELGVQIFVETHSDHVLNGIRVAVKKGVSNSNVKLFYFFRGNQKDKILSEFNSPNLDQDGRIDVWPENFFDEWDNNLMDLL